MEKWSKLPSGLQGRVIPFTFTARVAVASALFLAFPLSSQMEIWVTVRRKRKGGKKEKNRKGAVRGRKM